MKFDGKTIESYKCIISHYKTHGQGHKIATFIFANIDFEF
jgi:hypothetical protein